MNSNLLPSYTTEKYYLLSEIEDRAIFEAVEKDADAPIPEDIITAMESVYKDKEVYDAFYVLWDLRSESNKTDSIFKQDIEKLIPKMKDLSTVMEKALLSIEIIIDQNQDLEEMRAHILIVINWIRETQSFGCIYIGICDSVAGTPALEAVLDLAKMIDDHNLYEASLLSDVLILRVIAINNEQFLGHDPSREPDAESNVYQSEMIFIHNGAILDKSTVEDDSISVSYWATTSGLEHTKVLRDKNGQRGKNVEIMSKPNNYFSLLLFIIVCIAAYIYQ
eukprot:CAMPEP_0119042250 /NCGR_PEP_ID=MMETSP1177-20130426/14487_1 /TAXON_ID=2985 /ORGANISM="Ochromonas sp, Strain CCMP1899" /LENGTH=277 /DNA_ID=CAMNT_0007008901 /DNA_START=133 /DNA_END=963 /DNA_ORIENTATION=-